MMTTKQSKTELVERIQSLENELSNAKSARDTRELVHSLINFTSDEIGRTLVNTTDSAWCATHNMEMLTPHQAEVLLSVLDELVKQSSFLILSRA